MFRQKCEKVQIICWWETQYDKDRALTLVLPNDCLIQFLPDLEILSPDDLNALKFFSQQQLV